MRRRKSAGMSRQSCSACCRIFRASAATNRWQWRHRTASRPAPDATSPGARRTVTEVGWKWSAANPDARAAESLLRPAAAPPTTCPAVPPPRPPPPLLLLLRRRPPPLPLPPPLPPPLPALRPVLRLRGLLLVRAPVPPDLARARTLAPEADPTLPAPTLAPGLLPCGLSRRCIAGDALSGPHPAACCLTLSTAGSTVAPHPLHVASSKLCTSYAWNMR